MSSNIPTLENPPKFVATRRISHVEDFDTLTSSSVSPYIEETGATQPETTMPVEAICYALNRVGFDKDNSGAFDVFPKYVGTLPRAMPLIPHPQGTALLVNSNPG